MAKARMIDSAIWQDEDLRTLPVGARLLYVGMLLVAEPNGRIRGGAAYLRAHIFPYDDVENAQIDEWITALYQIGFVTNERCGASETLFVNDWQQIELDREVARG